MSESEEIQDTFEQVEMLTLRIEKLFEKLVEYEQVIPVERINNLVQIMQSLSSAIGYLSTAYSEQSQLNDIERDLIHTLLQGAIENELRMADETNVPEEQREHHDTMLFLLNIMDKFAPTDSGEENA